MKASSLVSLLLLVSSAFAGDDIRSKVAEATDSPKLTSSIDPDKSIYGIPFGTTEDQFIAAYGKPTGYVRLNGAETTMIYGNSHAFIFESGKLVGLRISSNILDWKLSSKRIGESSFDRIQWHLNNGIGPDTSLKTTRKILGERLLGHGYHQHYYKTDKARVELDFSHYVNEGDGEEAYRLFGILVRQGGQEPEDPLAGISFPEAGPSGMPGGIGVVLNMKEGDDSPRIVAVMPDTPAEKAGLRAGMRVLSVDGTSLGGKKLAECVKLLLGNAGTQVTLEVVDPGSSESKTVSFKRIRIHFRRFNPSSEP